MAELAAQPATWKRMLAEHTRTEDGFCAARSCGRPGTGTPNVTHPCLTRLLALRAQQHGKGTTGD